MIISKYLPILITLNIFNLYSFLKKINAEIPISLVPERGTTQPVPSEMHVALNMDVREQSLRLSITRLQSLQLTFLLLVAMEAVSESVEVPSCSLSFSFWTLIRRPVEAASCPRV